MDKEKDLGGYNGGENFFTDLEQHPSQPAHSGMLRRLKAFVVIVLVLFLAGLGMKFYLLHRKGLSVTENLKHSFMSGSFFGSAKKDVVEPAHPLPEEVEGTLSPAELESVPEFGSEIYKSISDPEIQRDMSSLDDKLKAFASKFEHTEWNGQTMLDAINLYNDIGTLVGKLNAFVYLQKARNRKDESISSLGSRVDDATSRVAATTAFFDLALSGLNADRINALLAEEPSLGAYKYVLLHHSMYSPHTLGLETEKYASRKSLVGSNAWNKTYNLLMSKAKLSVSKVGDDLNIAKLLNLMSSKDRSIRQGAAGAMSMFLNDNADVVSSIYNAIVRDGLVEKEQRGYSSAIGMRNLRNGVSDASVSSLLKSVRDAYPTTAHRYYSIKARILGLDKMRHFDRSAPLGIVKLKAYTFQDARDIVLDAYGAFSPKMKDIAQSFFSEGRIHAKVLPHKDNGAFCIGAAPSVKPYIMMNYFGSVRDVFTLAHELGHGVHDTLASVQPFMNYSTPVTTAEIASLFGERLLLDKLMSTNTDVLEKAQILANKIEDQLSTIIRQVAFAQFENKVHIMSESKDLSPSELSSIWLEVQRESLGMTFDLDSEYGNYWSYVSHFFHSPFYVYSYAFADLLVDRLYLLYKSGKMPDFEDKYIEMLSKGGSASHIDLLAPFGLNPESPDFWRESLSSLESSVADFEKMVNSIEFSNAMKAAGESLPSPPDPSSSAPGSKPSEHADAPKSLITPDLGLVAPGK